ncbi:putative lipoprotein, partial [Vibrio parahaemolyticus VPTS-2010_2]
AFETRRLCVNGSCLYPAYRHRSCGAHVSACQCVNLLQSALAIGLQVAWFCLCLNKLQNQE